MSRHQTKQASMHAPRFKLMTSRLLFSMTIRFYAGLTCWVQKRKGIKAKWRLRPIFGGC